MFRLKVNQLNRKKQLKGQSLAEFAGALVVLIPMLMVLAYLTYIVTNYFVIKTATDSAARIAARYLAINYNNPSINFKANFTNTAAYNFIRIQGIIISNSQFTNGSINSSTGQFQPLNPNPSQGVFNVAVQVQYPGGSSLPYWPNPNPSIMGISLWPFGNEQITSFCSYDVEP